MERDEYDMMGYKNILISPEVLTYDNNHPYDRLFLVNIKGSFVYSGLAGYDYPSDHRALRVDVDVEI